MKKESQPLAWVETVDQADASGGLAEAFAAVAGVDGKVENLYKAMSLTPGMIRPADQLYLVLLHDPASPLAPWLTELVATHVATLCGSRYAILNHGENFHLHFGDRARSTAILRALEAGTLDELGLEPPTLAALAFTRKLSLHPAEFAEADILALRGAGFCDTSISYLVQIVSSFAYWARVTIALGIRANDAVGLAGTPVSGAQDAD